MTAMCYNETSREGVASTRAALTNPHPVIEGSIMAIHSLRSAALRVNGTPRATVPEMPPLPVIDGVRVVHMYDFPGYAITDHGEVWCCRAQGCRDLSRFSSRWRLTAIRIGDNGYHVADLRKNGRWFKKCVARLMLMSFVGPSDKKMHTRHLDGNCLNDVLSNLKWGTAKENANDKKMHGTDAVGTRHGNAVLTEEIVMEARRLRHAGERVVDIASKLGVNSATIGSAINGKWWSHLPNAFVSEYSKICRERARLRQSRIAALQSALETPPCS